MTTTLDPAAAPAAPPVELAGGPLGAVQAADREIARQTALRARAVAEFAAARPASVDRAQGEPGAMSVERWVARPELLRGVSEWAAQELVVALSVSTQAAEQLLARSLTLVHRLPGTLRALETGALHVGHLWPMLEKVGPIEDAAVRAEVESRLLSWAAGRVTTPSQLGARARRELLTRDARGAARRLTAAIRERGVHLRPEATDGMASVTAVLTAPEALALHRALAALADTLDDPVGETRTHGQKMADCLVDLVLRPGDPDRPALQVLLTVVASVGTVLGGDAPGEIDGHVVPAEVVRDLLRACTGRPGESVADPTPPDLDPPSNLDLDLTVIPEPDPEPGPDPGRPTATEVGGHPLEPLGWDPSEETELARWWAEVEDRILAGELDCEPDRVPHDVLLRWATDGLPPDDEPPTGFAPPTDDPPTGFDLPTAAPPICLDPPGGDDPPTGRRATRAEDQQVGPPGPEPWAGDPADLLATGTDHSALGATGTEWWRTADRAVDDAGTAVDTATRALGRARRLVRTASAADAADEATWRASNAGLMTAAGDALGALAAATDDQREELAALLAASGGGGLAERPRIALTDALTGTLIALTDLAGLRRAGSCGARACRRRPGPCTHDLGGRPGLGAPGPTHGYRPGTALDRFVRARDRRCRFPGCRRRVPRAGELDHHRVHPDGPTSASNLNGFCTGHHRGKHQAPGWRYELAPDGTLTVRTPSGLTTSTTPPPY